MIILVIYSGFGVAKPLTSIAPVFSSIILYFYLVTLYMLNT